MMELERPKTLAIPASLTLSAFIINRLSLNCESANIDHTGVAFSKTMTLTAIIDILPMTGSTRRYSFL